MDTQDFVLKWLLESGWQSACMAVCVWLVLAVLGRRVPPAWRYGLWLLVAVRMLLPSLPESPASVYRVIPPTPIHAVAQASPRLAQAMERDFTAVPLLASSMTSAPSKTSFQEILFRAWAIGACGVLLLLAVRQIRFALRFRRDRREAGEPLQRAVETSAQQCGLRHAPAVWELEGIASPFLAGLWKPQLVVPAGMHERLGVGQARMVALHECMHLKRRDLWLHLISLAAGVAHWWNPVAWWLQARIRRERELATDAAVLALLSGDKEQADYGEVLLALAQSPKTAATLQPSVGIFEKHTDLKARLRQIASFAKSGWAWTAVGVVAVAACIPFFLKEHQPLKIQELTYEQSRSIQKALCDRVSEGDIAAVRRLIQSGADINSNLDVGPALWYAADEGNMEMIEFLLSQGADVNQKTDWGDPSVHRAFWMGHKAVADRLIAAGATYNQLQYGAGLGDIARLEKLRAEGAEWTKKDLKTALRFATTGNQPEAFDWLWKVIQCDNDTERTNFLGECYGIAAGWGRFPMMLHFEKMGLVVGPQHLEGALRQKRISEIRYLLEEKKLPLLQVPNFENWWRNIYGDGPVELVKLLLDHGAPVNTVDEHGDSVLEWGAYGQNDDVCLLLIERGADWRHKNKRGASALLRAATGANAPKTVKKLLELGADPNEKSERGETVLHGMCHVVPPVRGKVAWPGKVYTEDEMAEYGMKMRSIVNSLLDHGADINARDDEGRTPLMTALSIGHLAVAEALVDRGADVTISDNNGNTALSQSLLPGFAEIPDLDLVAKIITKGAPLEKLTISTPCEPEPAVFSGLSLLLQNISLRDDGVSSTQQTIKALVFILEKGAKFESSKTPVEGEFLKAACLGDLSKMKKLKAQGVDINAASTEDWTALSITLALDRKKVTAWLLKEGVRLQDTKALACAISRRNNDMVNMLLTAGTKPDANCVSRTISTNDKVLCERLLKMGVDIRGMLLLPIIQMGRAEHLKLLLEAGANPNYDGNSEKRTDVYWAVYYNQPECLKLLLDFGADPTVVTAYNETALSDAQTFHKDMVPMIQEAIAKWEAKHGKKPAIPAQN